MCGKATYKRGATDFSSQVATLGQRLRLRGPRHCAARDFGALGRGAQERLGRADAGAGGGLQRPGPALGGKVTEGLYGTPLTPHPYPDEANKKLMAWIASYKQKFNADPNAYTAIGYAQADLFVMAAQKAGPNLTPDSFAAALESLTRKPDFLGSPRFKFSNTDHLGSRATRLAQVRNGRWENITDYME